MYGDHSSHYNPNAGVGKTLIVHLIRWAAEHLFKDTGELYTTLRDVANMVISPELLPAGAGGEIVQKTEDLIGPYELHDFSLYHLVRFGRTPRTVARLAWEAVIAAAGAGT